MEKKVKHRRGIPNNQVGFRKGMDTMDQVYIPNNLVRRNLAREKGKNGSDVREL